MKKLLWYTLAALLTVVAFSSCKKDPEVEPDQPSNVVATVTASNLLDAVAAAYDAWEENTTIPTTLEVGGKSLTLPQYQYAIAKLLVNLASNDKGDIQVLGFKAADHPERDSYDQKEIAVTGGPKITEGTEDLVDIAKRMLAAMQEKLTVPNQTVITRSGASAIAFSTNRATVTLLRALAAYKSGGSLPAKVSTEYLSAAASLKGFAQQFVGILDIWEKTVGTVSADGSHCTDNNSAWQNVHFVPIPWSGGAYVDGKDQYDAQYQPYFTVTIDGKEYTSAQTWGIALRGIMDMLTKEGSGTLQQERNNFIHTMGNGASFKEPIPAVNDFDIWGQYPWYESTNDGVPINKDAISPYIIVRTASWFLTRQQGLEKIGNYQIYGTDDASELIEDGYTGFISSMRMWLIAARFYKYLLDNNITENVYDAVKNVTFATDLYGVEMPDIDLKTTSMTFVADGETKEVKFSAKKAWTATSSESWLKLEPASGDPSSEVTIKATADPNTADEREATIVIKGGNVTEGLEIPVIQGKYIAPTEATIKEFAQEYVKILNVWANTTGTIDMVTGEDYTAGSNNVENAHYVPSTTTITVAGKDYNTADMFETALRSYLLVRGYNGLDTQNYGPGSIAAREGGAASMAETPVPVTHDYTWGSWPFNETEGNGGYFRTAADEHCVVEVAILDNWAMRSLNYSGGKPITNMCGYPRDPAPMSNYTGSFCAQRALITYAFFFKYMLDNNLDKGTDLTDDTIIRTELFGNEGGEPIVGPTTIKDFAEEYVKILDIWQSTTGTMDMLQGENYQGGEWNVENAHYIPMTTTITVGNRTYNTADMFETAIRSYLLVRGYDGLDTEHYGAGSIAALDGGAASMSTTEVPETHGYQWGDWPYNETDGNGGHFRTTDEEHCVARVDVLDNWAMRALNYSGGKPISNMCTYPRNPLNNYTGSFCSMRALITYAFFFKYMLDKGYDKGTQVGDNDVIRTELFGDEGGAAAKITIKDFAKEYVKILDVWQSTTGTIDMLQGENYQGGEWNVENAHYIPSTTTITVGNRTYNTADMFETAIRSYLLVRGYDGLDTEHYGAGSIAALDGGAASMSTTEVPETHGYQWGDWPYNETDGNGGHFRTTDEEHCVARVDVLDNWAMRALNYSGGKPISNMCTYPRNPLNNYTGSFCSMRALITYAFFFKHMLDKGYDKGTQVGDNDVIRTELLGDESGAPAPTANSIKAFAQEYVKVLDVWASHVGTIEADGAHNGDNAWKNVHYIPVKSSQYPDSDNNKGDEWTMTFNGETFNLAVAYIIAAKGFLYLTTAEKGTLDHTKFKENELNTYTLGNGGSLNDAAADPAATKALSWAHFSKMPYYEGDDVMGAFTAEKAGVDLLKESTPWHLYRSEANGAVTNWQRFGDASSGFHPMAPKYSGYCCAIRECLILARFYKYLLDNNVEDKVYDAVKDIEFDATLY